MAQVKTEEITVTTEPISPVCRSPTYPDEGFGQPTRNVREALWAIVTSVALPCIPIIAIFVVLLYVIFSKRVQPWEGYEQLLMHTNSTTAKHDTAANLITFLKHEAGPAYLVKYNPSNITTISSWTSRILPYLTSSIMALVAFFAARHIVQKSKDANNHALPNPEQLTILIGLLGGNGLEPLKDTLFYRWLKKERLVSPLPAVFWIFAFITLLAFIIPVIDTWFGIAVHPISIHLLSNTTSPHLYGRKLDRTQCPNGPSRNAGNEVAIPLPKDVFWPCNILWAPYNNAMGALSGSTDVAKLQYNLPSSNALGTYTNPSDEHTWIYLADPNANPQLDFQATAPAISTQCIPMTKKCMNGALDPSYAYSYECTKGFQPNFASDPPFDINYNSSGVTDVSARTGIAFATDAQLSSIPPIVNVTSINVTWHDIVPQNPLYFGTWAYNYPSTSNRATGNIITGDGITDFGDGAHWFLNCTSTVAMATYTWVNGTVASFNPTPASPEMAAMIAAQFGLRGTAQSWDETMNTVMAKLATYAITANITDGLTATWAEQFSRNALALVSGVFVPEKTIVEQVRTASYIVARVPIIPLYLLLAFKLIYVVSVIALAVGAYAFTHPAETEAVKKQLSSKGLAAAHFDQPGLVQQNVVQVLRETLTKTDTSNNASKIMTAEDLERAQAEAEEAALPTPGIKRAATLMEGGTAPKVGLVPDADGAWKYVLLVDGVWHSIKPVVDSFVGNEASQGGFGEVGDVWLALKK